MYDGQCFDDNSFNQSYSEDQNQRTQVSQKGELNEFGWNKATHLGVCEKCRKNAGQNWLLVGETELNDKGLCCDHARRKKIFIGLIVAILFALLIAFVICFCNSWIDPNSKRGAYDNISQEDLNAAVAEGEMNVSIANTIVFDNGSEGEGKARIYNHKNNHVNQKVSLYLGDHPTENDKIYESGAIEPHHHIDTIKINKYLEPGTYDAVAIITGYEQDSGDVLKDFLINIFGGHKKTGALGAKINLLIK